MAYTSGLGVFEGLIDEDDLVELRRHVRRTESERMVRIDPESARGMWTVAYEQDLYVAEEEESVGEYNLRNLRAINK